jgi:hypothetical protein
MATLGKEQLYYRHMLGALERNFLSIARAVAQIGSGLQVTHASAPPPLPLNTHTIQTKCRRTHMCARESREALAWTDIIRSRRKEALIISPTVQYIKVLIT